MSVAQETTSSLTVFYWFSRHSVRWVAYDRTTGGRSTGGLRRTGKTNRRQLICRAKELFPGARHLGEGDDFGRRTFLRTAIRWMRPKMYSWAEQEGLDRTGQEIAAILMAGRLTQDSRLLVSLGGFERGITKRTVDTARRLHIWRERRELGNTAREYRITGVDFSEATYTPPEWADRREGWLYLLLDTMAVQGTIRRITRGKQVLYAHSGYRGR